MASEITMTGTKKLKTLASEFTGKFNYLTLSFRKGNGHEIDINKTIAEVREKKGSELSIVGNLKVGTLEKRFIDDYGIKVEVMWKKDGKLHNTSTGHDAMTITELDGTAKKTGCEKI